MATNLVSLVMNFLTPDMIGRIASALGLERNDTSTAVSAGVPALLAALVGATTKPGGPQKIADAAKQEMGTLDKFASMLGSAGASSVTAPGFEHIDIASRRSGPDRLGEFNRQILGIGIGRRRFRTRDVGAARYGRNRAAARLTWAGRAAALPTCLPARRII